MHTLSRFTYLRGTRFLCPAAGEYYLNGTTGAKFVHWNPPVPPPEAVIDRRTGQPQLAPAQEESARSHPEPADQAMRPEPEAEPEHSCSSYVEFVTSEEEGQYSHWSASPQSETAQEKGTQQRGQAESVRVMPALAEADARITSESLPEYRQAHLRRT